jgi:hypothetical protein
VFVVLHRPDGGPVYINPEQVIAVMPCVGCTGNAKALIETVNANIYVAETPADAVKVLQTH